ncbi:hypothetical protein [Bradyrhizobium sp. 141]|nr:hypothetical protein [Bradyrhizobium sp. 141]MCK1720991.1 hypothetical protein [Bradyrhizobium sp. 141]
MAGLVPAIHAFSGCAKNVDARDKPGHDGTETKRHDGAPGENQARFV